MDGSTMLAIGGVAVVVLGVVYFGVRFWLASTRPAAIGEVATPRLDRLNQEALERMGGDEEEEEEEEAPAGLAKLVEEEEGAKRKEG